MRKLIITLLAVSSFLTALADCPAPHAIHQVIVNQVSSWVAPGYEGLNENHIVPLPTAEIATFTHVEWATKYNNYNNKDGTTLCYYLTTDGTGVMLVQNKWGNVSEPSDTNWQLIFDNKNHLVKVCDHNCHFNYGS